MSMVKSQVCSRCQAELPLDSFYKDKTKPTGHSHTCIECAKEYLRDYTSKHREKAKATSLAWYRANTERSIKKADKYRRAHWDRIKEASYARRTPEAQKAWSAVSNGLKSGKLVRPSHCTECDTETVEFHHTMGYGEKYQLVGIWVCRTHHAAIHVAKRERERLLLEYRETQ